MISTLLIALASFGCDCDLDHDYDRSDWRHWIDLDGDCQDERTEAILRLAYAVEWRDSRMCRIRRVGILDPYTGKKSGILWGSSIHGDHVVALKRAHEDCLSIDTPEERRRFANDPLNILPTRGRLNVIKGHRGPESWLPPERQCQYVERWVRVKEKYSCIMRTEEHRAILAVAIACQERNAE
jgi:hypothetical protein